MKNEIALTAIDLFAGGGGLTVGLKRAGFDVVAAVEIEQHAHATYCANHPEISILRKDIRSVNGKHLLRLAGKRNIDLLAGCPPCQGFTSLTSKYKREDQRNTLVGEMARLVEEIRPRAVMMENVPGLAKKGQSLYENLKTRLRKLGYEISDGVLEVADFGVPQFRKRLVMFAGLGFEIDLPTPTHSKCGKDETAIWETVRSAISHMDEPLTLADAKKRGVVQDVAWHIVRSMSVDNVKRIKAAQAGKTWTSIPEELRPECHKGNYKGFTNVYGRMEWDQPSPTITGGCTTFSKGRFGHPVKDRTISVREAALLQTFPEDYKFDTPYMDYVCGIIGNALPCDFAEAVSRQCHRVIEMSQKRLINDRQTGKACR